MINQPLSKESEQALLGAILLNNSILDNVVDKLEPLDFYLEEHQKIFTEIKRLHKEKVPVDAITLCRNHISFIEHVGAIALSSPGVKNYHSYIEIILSKSKLRKLISHSQKIISESCLETANPEDLSHQIEIFLKDFTASGKSSFEIAQDVLPRVMARLDELSMSDSLLSGLSTGFNKIDWMTCGLQQSEIVIVAARPSMGKTAFAMNIASHVGMMKKPVLIFSLEMSRETLVSRFLSSIGSVDQAKIRSGKLQTKDWENITTSIEKLNKKPIYIDDSFSLNISEIKVKARNFAREHKDIALIIIDYLQLVTSPAHKNNRVEEVSFISRELKCLAMELKIPILVLSQLNRNVEARVDKRPVMSDIRDSGGIEQDADVVMMIYRDEVYYPQSTEKGIAEISFVKQRNGPTGVVKLGFNGQFMRFQDL